MVLSLNMSFGISGLDFVDSPTEYKDNNNEHLHITLKKCEDTFTWDKYPEFHQSLKLSLESPHISEDNYHL